MGRHVQYGFSGSTGAPHSHDFFEIRLSPSQTAFLDRSLQPRTLCSDPGSCERADRLTRYRGRLLAEVTAMLSHRGGWEGRGEERQSKRG